MKQPRAKASATRTAVRVLIREEDLRAYRKAGMVPNRVLTDLARALDRLDAPQSELDLVEGGDGD